MGYACPSIETTPTQPTLHEINGLVNYIEWIDTEMEMALEEGELARAGELASIQEKLLNRLMADSITY